MSPDVCTIHLRVELLWLDFVDDIGRSDVLVVCRLVVFAGVVGAVLAAAGPEEPEHFLGLAAPEPLETHVI